MDGGDAVTEADEGDEFGELEFERGLVLAAVEFEVGADGHAGGAGRRISGGRWHGEQRFAEQHKNRKQDEYGRQHEYKAAPGIGQDRGDGHCQYGKPEECGDDASRYGRGNGFRGSGSGYGIRGQRRGGRRCGDDGFDFGFEFGGVLVLTTAPQPDMHHDR